ncbi:hypothetical protein K2173_006830 [Erythroxylum novogranatense]|uniref:Major facilitator superfamily (MFS) profile domain-containing protein n=1 Tax=Erythroxylum novogranatense TaxID=1862640 RepID=A0AAV8SXW2_9ROSI|nr:hypothetical protein K2173_006830 [Erythroxylum novogranatense]
MAGGGFVSQGPVRHYDGKITAFVFITCVVGAMGGLIFGYDIGISGGVTSMDEFLKKFFPQVYRKESEAKEGYQNQYCSFDDQILTLFTSSLYLAALVASFLASTVTRVFGRKLSMLLGGLVFLVGAILNGLAVNIAMLIIGRILLGVGVGFANQSVPVYLSEMAPAKYRGALNIGFQMAITIGVFAANLINYGTSKIRENYGWRISLGLAVVPAILMTIGSLMLPDTPNSLLARGHAEQARNMLVKIRGTNDVDDEFQDLVDASVAAKQVRNPWKTLLKKQYRPQLMITFFIPMFQQLTGMNVIMFYAPVIFKTLGYGDDASLMSTVITGCVNVAATFVSIFSVDKFGRRMLLLEGGIQMLICQIIIAILLGLEFGTSGVGSFPKGLADLFIVLVCLFVAGFAWSWGPLGWLIPSEICPLEVRSAGQSVTVSVNMLFTFFVAQAFLSMLCHMKFGLFLFFGGFVVIMTLFVYFFIPETRHVPIEEINRLWREHWFWKRYMPDDVIGNYGNVQIVGSARRV